MGTTKTVCLIGRRKDWRLMRQAEQMETLRGNIVLTVGCVGPDGPLPLHDYQHQQWCGPLLYKKIAMSDEVLVFSKILGQGAIEDIKQARCQGKPVRYLHDEEQIVNDYIMPYRI